MLRFLSVVLAALAWLSVPAFAQNTPRGSECLAMAERPPRAIPVSLRRTAAKADCDFGKRLACIISVLHLFYEVIHRQRA